MNGNDFRRTRFLSGGYDKAVHLWTVDRNGDNYSASSQKIGSQNLAVSAIAYHAHRETVLSCAGPWISTLNLSRHDSQTNSARVSGYALQVHIHPENPHIVFLEVGHLLVGIVALSELKILLILAESYGRTGAPVRRSRQQLRQATCCKIWLPHPKSISCSSRALSNIY